MLAEGTVWRHAWSREASKFLIAFHTENKTRLQGSNARWTNTVEIEIVLLC